MLFVRHLFPIYDTFAFKAPFLFSTSLETDVVFISTTFSWLVAWESVQSSAFLL